MILGTPLLAAAALVGVLHMAAPDHWVTLCILGRASGWSRPRLLGVSIMAALGHVALSIVLGFTIIGVGLIFSKIVSFYVTIATGLIMMVGGLFYGIKSLLTSGDTAYGKKAMKMQNGNITRGVGYFAVLGSALSPDLSILPIFLVAFAVSLSFAIDAAIVFAIGSMLALSLLVLAGSVSVDRVLERVSPRYNNTLIGIVIAAVGVYILFAR